MHRKIFIIPTILCVIAATALSAVAHNAEPTRIVDNKYTIILLLEPKGENTLLQFIFRDSSTGKNLLSPVKYHFSVVKGDTTSSRSVPSEILSKSPELSAVGGVGRSQYRFPNGGLYKLALDFEVGNNPGKTYHPDSWSLWIPGPTASFWQRYPIGPSEIAGFGLLLAALGAVLASLWFNKRKGRELEINFLEWFGLK